MTSVGPYEFWSRAVLTESALDAAGRVDRRLADDTDGLRASLHFELFDEGDLAASVRMANIYTAITAFERSARRFIAKVMQEAHGDTWWDTKVSKTIRDHVTTRRQEEERNGWHGVRGQSPLAFTEMKHLVQIMQQNEPDFEAYVPRLDWARNIFQTIERSRNVIMHSGVLEQIDIDRVGMNIRDWLAQVGGA